MATTSSIPRSGLTMAERQALLLAGDLVCVLGAVLISWAVWIWIDGALEDPIGFLRSKDALTPFLLLGPLWFFLIFHLYDPHVAFSRERTISGLALATGVSLIPYLGLYFFASPGSLPRVAILVFLATVTILEFGWRTLAIHLFTLT